jgi:hypothetical protein
MAGGALAAVERMGVTLPRLTIRDARHITDAEFAQIDALCEGPFWKASQQEPLTRDMVEPGMEIVLFRDDSDTLVGLTMVAVDRITVEGRGEVAFSVLDTYLKPAMRHHEQAAMAYAVLSLRELVRNRGRAIYAVMPTGTYHGYELVTHTLATFYPRPGQEPPPREQAILAAVAERRFSNIWDPARGVLVHPQNLVPAVVEIPEERLADPVVAFFAERNPGYREGDVLMCIARITWDVPVRNVIRWTASSGHAAKAFTPRPPAAA